MSSKPGRSASSEDNSKLLSILDISRRLNAERDPTNLLELMAREATRLLSADRASIFLLDRENLELLSRVALGSRGALRFDARLGIAGSAAMNNETINVSDAQEDPRFYPQIDSLSGYRTKTVLAVPMRRSGQVVGTFEVLNKKGGPFTSEDEELLAALADQAAIAIENAQTFQELQDENRQLRKSSATQKLLGTSRRIQEIVRLIDTISDSAINVLIQGESGTGKELVAQAIHAASPRATQPFVALNSAALPEHLVESELFGIEKGVATGVEQRIGKFEEAHRGTIFLDEIGDLSPAAQAKILRAVQEQVVVRVGGRKPIPVDVRIVAATHRDLEQLIANKEFREDLYYRLKVVEIRTPALREIPEDIPLLASHLLNEACRRLGKAPKELSRETIDLLSRYRWPGNVRELENEMERAAVSVRRRTIEPADLSIGSRAELKVPKVQRRQGETLKEVVGKVVADLESKLINEAMAANQNNQLRTAKALGLSRQGLIKKMKRYGLK